MDKVTGEKLHKRFKEIKKGIPNRGANYFRDRKVFEKMAAELNEEK